MVEDNDVIIRDEEVGVQICIFDVAASTVSDSQILRRRKGKKETQNPFQASTRE